MASRRSSSDPEMERVIPGVDLVTFHGVPSCYSQGADITVKYSLGSAVSPSSQDWVGLFQAEWGTTEDYLTYVWAPVRPHNLKSLETCEVVFSANQLQALKASKRKYQFLFVSRGSFVAGVSRLFRLSPPDTASPCQSTSHSSSYSLLSSSASLDIQGFEDLGEPEEDQTCIAETIEPNRAPSSPDVKTTNITEKSHTVLSAPAYSGNETEVLPKKPVIIAGKSKRSIVKITRDSSTLAGSFDDSTPLVNQLCFVNPHPIVREYMDNKERSLVPYMPLYSLANPAQVLRQTKANAMVSHLGKAADIKIYVSNKSSNWSQLELLSLCTQCSVANTLVELYRHRLTLEKAELKDLKMNVFCLKKGLEARDEKIRMYKRREAKQKKTEETIEEVISQMGCLKNDINNLLGQNNELETERNHLQSKLEICTKRQEDSEMRCSGAENQLNDILFSLSMKGYNSVVDFSGKNINLSEIKGEAIDVEGWKVYKNKRCGRLLAVISQQERSNESLQASLGQTAELCANVQEELNDTQQLLAEAKDELKTKEELLSGVKQALSASLKREEHTTRMLASADSELTQYKYEAETREHHMLKEIHELKEQLQRNQPSAMMAFTNRLVATGLASVPDVCKTNWCASLCPTYANSHEPSVPEPFVRKQEKTNTKDAISWENEEPIAKQPKVSKKATKRSHRETERQERSAGKGGRGHHKVFPETCPVCGISFAKAVDSRVVDEHLAFHDVYRV